MKLLLIIVDDSHKEEVEAFLHKSGVPGYTEIPHALGTGATGPRMGSRAFPKTSALILSLIEEDTLQRLREGIRIFCADCGERVRMVVLGGGGGVRRGGRSELLEGGYPAGWRSRPPQYGRRCRTSGRCPPGRGALP